MSELRSKLVAKYEEILIKTDQNLVFKDLRLTPDYTGFSDLFLTDAPAEWTSGKRVLIVGRETRGWGPKPPARYEDGITNLICRLMDTQSAHYEKYVSVAKEPGMRFFHFVRNVAKIVGKGNVAWGNTFAMDWKRSTPTKRKTPHFESLIDLSGSLLKAQIEILQPDVIIFAAGKGGAGVRRRFFPTNGAESVCSEPRDFDGIANANLWAFKLYGKIQCYRIDHPSSRDERFQIARARVLQELKSLGGA